MKTVQRKIEVNGKACELTPTEYELYLWMHRHQGKVVTRDALLKNVWGFLGTADTRSVDMCIRRLRAKIGVQSIQTIYGQGYIMTI